MPHLSENSQRLSITIHSVHSVEDTLHEVFGFNDVCVIRLPVAHYEEHHHCLDHSRVPIQKIADTLGSDATLIVIGQVNDLVHIHRMIEKIVRYQLWAAVKTSLYSERSNGRHLLHQHIGMTVYTKYAQPLRHTKTRIGYTYCPTCQKTTKDYGGKKHTYHAYGTLLSDVWRDLEVQPDGNFSEIYERLADLFGIEAYHQLRVLDFSHLTAHFLPVPPPKTNPDTASSLSSVTESALLQGDVLSHLGSSVCAAV